MPCPDSGNATACRPGYQQPRRQGSTALLARYCRPQTSSFYYPFPFPDIGQLIAQRCGLFRGQRLYQPTGPADLYVVYTARRPYPKVQPRGALAGVTVATVYLAEI